MTFADTRTVIIGGSSGIGYATAEQIVSEGGEVVVVARDDERRKEAARTLGPNATERALDITDRAAVAQTLTEAEPDYLVCTPAYIPTGMDISEEDLRQAFEVKFFGYYYAAEAVRQVIPDDGAIVFLSGEAAVTPDPQYFAVGVVNAAVETLTKYLALEYAPVRVSAVSPNVVDTFGMDDAMRERVAANVPVDRVAEPEDVAVAVCLALDNPNMSGETLRLNGGSSLV
jgi:NAD(P)-dependent dehydrogenase (short-subunit alcohol dehydrogenase family)